MTDKEIFEAIIAKLDDPLVEKHYEYLDKGAPLIVLPHEVKLIGWSEMSRVHVAIEGKVVYLDLDSPDRTELYRRVRTAVEDKLGPFNRDGDRNKLIDAIKPGGTK